MRTIFTIFIFIGSLMPLYGQQFVVSKVNLKTRENKMASNIPNILLDAYSKGEIKGYYPKNMNVPVSYVQFLNHFGMKDLAYQELASSSPSWFCIKKEAIPTDESVVWCMQYELEIGEELYRNHISQTQEKRFSFVKVIYSGECTSDGFNVDGPVFKVSDITKLRDESYGIVNPQNPALAYSIMDLLRLRLYLPEDY